MTGLKLALATLGCLSSPIVSFGLTPREWLDFDPLTDPNAQVVVGKARFSVYHDQVIRMEYSAKNQFQDAATFTFIRRKQPVPKFTHSTDGNIFKLQTKYLTLTYNTSDARSFNAANLKVDVQTSATNQSSWVPSYTGTNHANNLFGTLRTLDNNGGFTSLDCQNGVDVNNQHCTYGLVGRDGYVVVDDTHQPFFNGADWPMPVPTYWDQKDGGSEVCTAMANDRVDCGFNGISQDQCQSKGCCWHNPVDTDGIPQCFYSTDSDQDLYMFGFGSDYRGALKAYTSLSGDIPVPPRFSFGVWYSRYWAYSDVGYQNIVKEYEEHSVPLDVLVTDMDWHDTFYAQANKGVQDQAGQTIGWTGFTFDKHLFPSPSSFLNWCKRRGLKNTLNLHPASGMQPWEEKFSDMAVAMGQDPSTGKYVPFNITDEKYIRNWFNIVLKPLEQAGIDFWWLDWQQGESWIKESQFNLQNPTFLLNHYFFTNPSHFTEANRPLLFHRWGGLGNHRYQIGFSGDVFPSWDSLSFQPYFTATAANVAYAYWSHDLGGHQAPTEPQLYTRWLQWGAFAPIFRTHCTKNAANDRRIWTYPWQYYNTLRTFMKFRQSLVPYTYTQAHITHQTSVATVHPLYYDFPADNRSYTYINQYMFGDLLVQPIVQPVDTTTDMTATTVFVPQGEWVGLFSGVQVTGPSEVKDSFTISEMPIYAPVGLILPLLPSSAPVLGASQYNPSHLDLHAYVYSSTHGQGEVIEDDGESMSYALKQEIATQKFSYDVTGENIVFKINAYQGATFDSRPKSRSYSLYLHGVLPSASVTVNGAKLSQEAYDVDALTRGEVNSNSYMYDGATLTNIIHLRVPSDTTADVSVSISLLSNVASTSFSELSGKFVQQLSRFLNAKDLLDDEWGGSHEVYQDNYPNLLLASETGQMISAAPQNVVALLQQFTATYQPQAIQELTKMNMDQTLKTKLLAQLA